MLAKEVFEVKARETPDIRHGAEAGVAVDHHVVPGLGPTTQAEIIHALCRNSLRIRATKPTANLMAKPGIPLFEGCAIEHAGLFVER